MADIKVIYVNADGILQEHNSSVDSIQVKSLKTANYELTDELLGTLVTGGDASANHNHDGRYYLKSEVDSAISNAEQTLQTEINGLDTRLDVLEADSTTKTYVDSKFSTAQSYTDQKISDLINGAPAILDTFKEIADQLANDESIVTSLNNTVANNLTEAKSYASGLVNSEQTARIAADNALDTRLTILETLKDAQLVYVTKSGSDVTGTGGQHKPFASLTAALASITDASPTKRYVISVGPGNYTESSLPIKANVFIVGKSKESVRITGAVSMASDFTGSSDHRSGFSMVSLLSAADFNWQTVTSAAGKLYFNEVVFGSTLNMYGHNNAIAQAQFDSCIMFGAMTVSGINVGVYNNCINYANITLNQHPNGGMATILAASGGNCGGTVTLNASVNDFNRRCSLFARNFYMEYVTVNGPSAYADVNEGSLPRSRDRIVSQNSGNIVYTTAKSPHVTNTYSLGEPGYQHWGVFSYVHASTDSDLYVISMGNSYDASDTGRSIFLESDSYGLNQNVNGGDINLTTAATSGTGIRGKIKLDAREVDVVSSKIINLAAGVNANDAINKSQLDAQINAITPRISSLEAQIGAVGSVYTVGAGGVNKGDLVYISGNDTVSKYSNLASSDACVGIAASTVSAGGSVRVLANDTLCAGALSSATAGSVIYWTGNGYSLSMPSGSGQNVYQVGIARNATDLSVEVVHIKKNS